MFKKTLPLLVLAALLVPAAAQAKKIEVTGPASIVGRGPVHGGLHAESQATINFRFRAAMVRITGKADDLKVTCNGRRAKTLERTNRRGLKVVGCMGRGLQIAVTATRFRFTARARGAYGIQVPEGMSGVLYGHFRRDGEAARPERPADPEQSAEDPAAAEAEETQAVDA
jgi:hypothetical protein